MEADLEKRKNDEKETMKIDDQHHHHLKKPSGTNGTNK